MSQESTCYICKEPCDVHPIRGKDATEVECRRCGLYWITRRLAIDFEQGVLTDDLRPFVAAATRQARESGSFARLAPDNWRDLAIAHSKTRYRDKSLMLLRYVAQKTRQFGEGVPITSTHDYPIIDAASPEEFVRLFKHLSQRHLLSMAQARAAILTMEGWDVVDPPESPGGTAGRCFVAMSFDPSLNDAWELGIRAALVEDCQLSEPVRMDKEEHNENISNRILAEIRLSQFVVADFTLQRQGVYFEAGFAMALGRPVVWTCQKDDFENTHFDTQQFNHVIWTDPQDLRAKLRDRVLATIPISQ